MGTIHNYSEPFFNYRYINIKHERPQDFDFEFNNSHEWNYILYPNFNTQYPYPDMPVYYDDTIDSAEGGDIGSASQMFNTESIVKLVLITIIFFTAAVGSAMLTYVINMVPKKTLRQKMLISVLAITCCIRAAVYFIRDIYVVTYNNKWEFNLVICKADAFLDNFSTAVFPYVLIFLVYDSARFVCCTNTNRFNPKTTYTNKAKFINLVILIITFLSVITFPLVFSIVLTIMTTTKTISSYGEDIKVNSTTCLLDINMFEEFSPFKSYILFHAPMWLIFIPVTLIAIIYVILAIRACCSKCVCVRKDLSTRNGTCSETNHQTLFIERMRIDKNWLITIICLVVIYVICYVPYNLTKLLYNYLDLPNSKVAIMIIFFLFYAPPALIPIILSVVDIVINQGYLQHIFCLRNKNKQCNNAGTNSNNVNNAESSWKGSNSIVSNSTIYTNTNKSEPGSPSEYRDTVTISVASDYDHYSNNDDENTHIIPSSPDMSNCSQDDWSSGSSNGSKKNGQQRSRSKKGGKDIKEVDNEEDSDAIPILVTSL